MPLASRPEQQSKQQSIMTGGSDPAGFPLGDAARARAFALHAAERDWEAGCILERLHAAGMTDAALIQKLGWVRIALGDSVGAETCMREALAAAPDAWESNYAVGAALRGRDDAAALRY
ncbi:MAG: hypothetical protein ACREX6_07345, partial [Casimicrobiaceae bacterium]